MKENVELKNNILKLLENCNLSIPDMRGISGENDEYIIAVAVGQLEESDNIELKGFKTIYREDGGCIHLALYGLKKLGDNYV